MKSKEANKQTKTFTEKKKCAVLLVSPTFFYERKEQALN